MLYEDYKLGIISNFTYAPVIYAGVRKVGINNFFNIILVSDAVGWRKPHAKIFEEALKRLDVRLRKPFLSEIAQTRILKVLNSSV